MFGTFVTLLCAGTALGRCLTQTPVPPVYANAPAVPPVYGTQCALRFQACGGDASYAGPTTCCGDNVCTVSNPNFSICLPTALPADVAAEGQKCGGEGWNGPTKCEALTVCTVMDSTYSLCQSVFGPPPPTENMPPPAMTPMPPAMTPVPVPAGFNASACAFRYEACGGENVASRCCHGDNVCKVESKWFSSCQPAPLPADVQREWGRCDEPGFPSKCEALTSCVQISDTEKQCRSIFPQPPAPPSPQLPPRPDGLVRRWGQCGGIVESKACEPGNDCVKQNLWYSQCLPAAVPEGTKRVNEHCGSKGQPDDPCEVGTTCTPVNEWYSLCKADV